MKKALIIIDMQNDFVSGSLGSADAAAIVPAVIQEIKNARNENTDLIFTRDTHQADYLSTNEGQHLPVIHCVKDTKGWEIIDELKEAAANAAAIIDKPSFGSLELTEYIAKSPYTELELIGLCTDICVVSNALLLKARLPEIQIKVVPECCAGVTKESHLAALETMKMCQIDF